jgi:hypothetical protein
VIDGTDARAKALDLLQRLAECDAGPGALASTYGFVKVYIPLDTWQAIQKVAKPK